ncbi:MAG: transcriptional regulator [Acutalibacteraceae bacterium]|nr:transcriptional regulator [Acutalibacteraceae bacterium]
MARQATKACGNRYFEARMRAAKYNEKLLTRAGAVECLPGVTEDSLKKYELDITRPPNIVVALMADAYNEPELRAWYCANECPLGKDCREIPEMPAERALIRLQNSVYEMEQLTRQLSLLMEDGTIETEQQTIILQLRDRLLEFRRRADENLAALERAARRGSFE